MTSVITSVPSISPGGPAALRSSKEVTDGGQNTLQADQHQELGSSYKSGLDTNSASQYKTTSGG